MCKRGKHCFTLRNKRFLRSNPVCFFRDTIINHNRRFYVRYCRLSEAETGKNADLRESCLKHHVYRFVVKSVYFISGVLCLMSVCVSGSGLIYRLQKALEKEQVQWDSWMYRGLHKVDTEKVFN